MKKSSIIPLTASLLLLTITQSGQAAVPYFPYETIDKYYKPQPEAPPPPPPAAQQPPDRPVKAPPQARQPGPITQPPDFLFPAKLGFGVAVGVPYDMMYLSKTFYYWQSGVWYRSLSYRGPWTPLAYSQLPPELRKTPLSKIRSLRNSEFRTYWKDQQNYQGKRFNPGTDAAPQGPNGELQPGNGKRPSK